MKGQQTLAGFSRSAWKSLAVKSLRLGWPEGIARGQTALGRSEIVTLLVCGVFEDIFPAESELGQVMAEVKGHDYASLCARATHHTRGYTAEFCRLEGQAVAAAEQRKPELWAQGRRFGVWLPQRSLNCWFTWLALRPTDAGKIRTIDVTPWTGMPEAMLDGHTPEGCKAGRQITLLSGHYENHLRLAQLVERVGWAEVRKRTHGSIASPVPDPQGEFGFA
jgi:hypothetical protein